MKLHFHPVSTASRPVVLFCAEAKIEYEPVIVDIMTGAHHSDAYKKLSPSSLIPVLEDGDFVLSESSAILKYLADKVSSPEYPKDLKKRARVNERMDWINTQFYRDYGYNLIYPQLFPHHKRHSDEAHSGTIKWGAQNTAKWLQILDKDIIGSHKYIAGDELTIADHFASIVVSIGDLIGQDMSKYPNITRWMNTMRALPSWKKVNEAADGFAAMNKGKDFVRANA
jgi:glutathione S-transferase